MIQDRPIVDDGRTISIKSTDPDDLAILAARFNAITDPEPEPTYAVVTLAFPPYVSAAVQYMVRDARLPGGMAPRAAIVTAIQRNNAVDLVVLNREGMLFKHDVPFGGAAGWPGTWRWAPELQP